MGSFMVGLSLSNSQVSNALVRRMSATAVPLGLRAFFGSSSMERLPLASDAAWGAGAILSRRRSRPGILAAGLRYWPLRHQAHFHVDPPARAVRGWQGEECCPNVTRETAGAESEDVAVEPVVDNVARHVGGDVQDSHRAAGCEGAGAEQRKSSLDAAPQCLRR